MHPLVASLLKLIYPLPEQHLKRDRPLRVLALGISRSGTESLRNALEQLGYHDVHHGFRFITDDTQTLQWIRLAHAQASGRSADLTTADFDAVLGDCEAVTDQPSCGFAHELLTAYPDAKIILNYRQDVEAWHRSVVNTIEKFSVYPTWYDWLLSYFQADMFWQQHVSVYWNWRRYFNSDFEQKGRKWYQEHYAGLEERLRREGRLYLKWKVEDDWGPLCNFLEKPTPKSPFPSGNTPSDYEAKMASIFASRLREARRNLNVACVGLAVVFLVGMSIWIR